MIGEDDTFSALHERLHAARRCLQGRAGHGRYGMNQIPTPHAFPAPALIAAAGDRATYRFSKFFTVQVRNPHTRRAYARAVGEFSAWLDRYGLPSITAVSSIHIATYIEEFGRSHSVPTVKQRLAAIRMLFDWLATGGVLPFNPRPPCAGRSTW